MKCSLQIFCFILHQSKMFRRMITFERGKSGRQSDLVFLHLSYRWRIWYTLVFSTVRCTHVWTNLLQILNSYTYKYTLMIFDQLLPMNASFQQTLLTQGITYVIFCSNSASKLHRSEECQHSEKRKTTNTRSQKGTCWRRLVYGEVTIFMSIHQLGFAK